MTNYIPKNTHSIVPFLVVKGAAKAIDFYVKAFGAKEVVRMAFPGTEQIMYSKLELDGSSFTIVDENPSCGSKSPETLGGVASSLFVYVKDADASFKQAVAAGCTSMCEPTDMFWGDRFSAVTDPFGHQWSLATHVEDLSYDEMMKRQEAFCKQMAGAGAGR